MLFRPTDLWGSEGLVFFGGGRNHAAPLINNERARAASAYVNAEDVNGSLTWEAEIR
jgi:hypothetical protein